MNQELSNIIKIYSTKSHKELNKYLVGKSKELLMATLLDLITIYINDKNSSTLREYITVSVAGYQHQETKLGYNGFKQSSFDPGKTINCEAKPKNVNTENKTIAKLNGGGNFSDYTFKRLKKHKKEEGLNMLVSGFIDGKLIYVIEFPFNSSGFIKRLRKLLLKRFPDGKDKVSEYLRSAEFSYKHYKNTKKLKIIYSLSQKELSKKVYKKYITGDFLKFLMSKRENEK